MRQRDEGQAQFRLKPFAPRRRARLKDLPVRASGFHRAGLATVGRRRADQPLEGGAKGTAERVAGIAGMQGQAIYRL